MASVSIPKSSSEEELSSIKFRQTMTSDIKTPEELEKCASDDINIYRREYAKVYEKYNYLDESNKNDMYQFVFSIMSPNSKSPHPGLLHHSSSNPRASPLFTISPVPTYDISAKERQISPVPPLLSTIGFYNKGINQEDKSVIQKPEVANSIKMNPKVQSKYLCRSKFSNWECKYKEKCMHSHDISEITNFKVNDCKHLLEWKKKMEYNGCNIQSSIDDSKCYIVNTFAIHPDGTKEDFICPHKFCTYKHGEMDSREMHLKYWESK